MVERCCRSIPSGRNTMFDISRFTLPIQILVNGSDGFRRLALSTFSVWFALRAWCLDITSTDLRWFAFPFHRVFNLSRRHFPVSVLTCLGVLVSFSLQLNVSLSSCLCFSGAGSSSSQVDSLWSLAVWTVFNNEWRVSVSVQAAHRACGDRKIPDK